LIFSIIEFLCITITIGINTALVQMPSANGRNDNRVLEIKNENDK